MWVFRTPGEAQKYLSQNVAVIDKSGSISLIVWGCFIGTTFGPLVSFRGVNIAVTYVAALQENLLPFLDTLPVNIKINFIFQQDNARIHTANIFKAMVRDTGI